MLAEAHFLFDVIDPGARFEAYEALVLPDHVRLDARLAAKVRAYLAPAGTDLEVTFRAGRVEVAVPRLDGHGMVVLE